MQHHQGNFISYDCLVALKWAIQTGCSESKLANGSRLNPQGTITSSQDEQDSWVERKISPHLISDLGLDRKPLGNLIQSLAGNFRAEGFKISISKNVVVRFKVFTLLVLADVRRKTVVLTMSCRSLRRVWNTITKGVVRLLCLRVGITSVPSDRLCGQEKTSRISPRAWKPRAWKPVLSEWENWLQRSSDLRAAPTTQDCLLHSMPCMWQVSRSKYPRDFLEIYTSERPRATVIVFDVLCRSPPCWYSMEFVACLWAVVPFPILMWTFWGFSVENNYIFKSKKESLKVRGDSINMPINSSGKGDSGLEQQDSFKAPPV